MIGFRLSAQRPPDPQRITDAVVMRFDHVYEVDPALMTEHVRQQEIPAWETAACIQCGKCAMVCPHAAIRIKAYDPALLADALPTFKSLKPLNFPVL